MRHLAESLTAGLAILLASTLSPRAADWAVGSGGAMPAFGSIKDYRNAAVPVPAPTPAPHEFPDWYVRADIGYNFATNVNITATGGVPQPDSGNVSNFAYGSLGFGRYITPSIRADFTFDLEPKRAVTKSPQGFTKVFTQPGAGGSTDTLNYQVTNADGTGTADQTGLINFYYDFHNASRFTPYVGGGLGLDFKSLKRNYTQNATCSSATNSVSGPYAVGTCPALTSTQPVTGFNHSTYATTVGFAAALMVGASYKVTDGISIDGGYRMLYDGGSLTASGDGINGATNLTVGDRLNHELRTGIRIDLD